MNLSTLRCAAGACLITLGLMSGANAQCDYQQIAKLRTDDGAAYDLFGASVAMSGTTAIVGAWFDDDNGSESGSAYLFDITDPADPTQLFKLLAEDGVAGDSFGISVAISGHTAVVGAYYNDDACPGDPGCNSGSAYLFDTTTGRQIAKLLADDGAINDRFGISVAISGNTVIIGANLGDDNGPNSGSAYFFDATTGLQIAKLLPNDGAEADFFGTSVAINSTTAIIGAYGDDDNGSRSGSAYLFDIATREQIAKLLPDDGAAGDGFGFTVAINSDTVIVSAGSDDDNGLSSGSAYLFDSTTGQQIAKLLPDDGAQGDQFSDSVAISDNTAIVGAIFDGDNGSDSGSAYLFDISDPAYPTQIAKFLANDGAEGDNFGGSIAISETTAIVGALGDDDIGDDSGSAYLFDLSCACYADCNEDNLVNTLDFICFLNQYNTSDPAADCNADGIVNTLDFLCFLNAYNDGC